MSYFTAFTRNTPKNFWLVLHFPHFSVEQVHVVGRHRLDVGLTRHFDVMAFVFGLGLLLVIRQTVDEEAAVTLKGNW